MKNKNERGAVVVEASIIVTLVIFFVAAMLYLCFIMYQHTMLSVVANQTAENIAQVYSNNLKDPFTGFIEPDQLYESTTYTDMKNDAYKEVVEKKAAILARYRLESYSLIGAESDAEVEVHVVKKANDVLKSQIEVTIRNLYDMPLAALFDVSGLFDMTVSGRADCVDILEYVNGVEAIGDPENSNIGSIPDMNKCKILFVIDKYNPQLVAEVEVLQDNSILGSAGYTRSAMPGNPQWGQRHFSGWKLGDGRSFSASTLVEEDVTVYGKWAYEVSLVGEGGTIGNKNTYSFMTEADQCAVLPNAVRSGYAFEGWYTGKNGNGTRYASQGTAITSNITLYAHWRCTHDYSAEKIANGNCRVRSTWKYKCVRCPYTYEAAGNYGSCEQGAITEVKPSCEGQGSKVARCKHCSKVMLNEKIPALGHTNQSYSKASTCTEVGFKGQKCTRCGKQSGNYLETIPHDYSARCGVDHWTWTYITAHNKSAGYTGSSCFQCLICQYCGGPYNGKWTWRGGVKTSSGVICWYHNDNYGYNQKDNAYKHLPIKPIH